jgi:hypothetical protein
VQRTFPVVIPARVKRKREEEEDLGPAQPSLGLPPVSKSVAIQMVQQARAREHGEEETRPQKFRPVPLPGGPAIIIKARPKIAAKKAAASHRHL